MLHSFALLLDLKVASFFFFFYQLNILGAEAWLVFLIIPSPDIFYLAF